MPIDDATWEQVRIAYCTSKLSVAGICKQFKVTSPGLYQRRIKEGWPLRGTQPAALSAKRVRPAAPATPDTPDTPTAPSAKSPPPPTARAARASLILRLYHAIDMKLTQMEKLMTQPDPDKPTSSADHERETRALTGLIRNFERVTELNSDLTSPTRSARAASAPSTDASTSGPALATAASLAATSPASAELLRRDIAQRLERILGKGNPPGNAG